MEVSEIKCKGWKQDWKLALIRKMKLENYSKPNFESFKVCRVDSIIIVLAAIMLLLQIFVSVEVGLFFASVIPRVSILGAKKFESSRYWINDILLLKYRNAVGMRKDFFPMANWENEAH